MNSVIYLCNYIFNECNHVHAMNSQNCCCFFVTCTINDLYLYIILFFGMCAMCFDGDV